MKKMFISVIALAMSVMAMATETAYVEIKLLGETGGSNSVFLFEDDAYTNAFEPGADVEKIMSQANSKSVLMYGFVGTTPCEDVVAANLDGLSLGFTTNQVDQNYTLKFVDVEGRALTLYDRLLNVSTPIVNNGTYNFTATEGRVAVNDRFFINLDEDDFSYSLTTNAYGWASYSNDLEDVELTSPAGLKIYTGEFDGVETLALTQVDYVKAGQGVVVKGAANTTYYFAAGTGASVYGTNHLKPTSAFDPANYQNVFVLKDEALYEYVGTTALAANKAYLQLPGGPSSAPKRITLRVEETQGIENVVASEKAEKFVENGQIFIKRGEAVYNLQGQVVK